MRTTVTIKDELLRRLEEYVGPMEKSVLVNLALTRLVESEASRRLALLGASCPALEPTPRRRFHADGSWTNE